MDFRYLVDTMRCADVIDLLAADREYAAAYNRAAVAASEGDDIMKPSPLIPEDRAYAQRLAEGLSNGHDHKIIIRRLLAAEQYWREAVKNAKPAEENDEYPASCAFCDELDYHEPAHKTDCPWLLAQG